MRILPLNTPQGRGLRLRRTPTNIATGFPRLAITISSPASTRLISLERPARALQILTVSAIENADLHHVLFSLQQPTGDPAPDRDCIHRFELGEAFQYCQIRAQR